MAARGDLYRRVEVHSGKEGQTAQALPRRRATSLRHLPWPLRDAEQALSAGRGSRLSQVLHHTRLRSGKAGVNFDPELKVEKTDPTKLNVLGIGDFPANARLA